MTAATAFMLSGMWGATAFAMWLTAKHNDSGISTPFMMVIVTIPAAIVTAQFAHL